MPNVGSRPLWVRLSLTYVAVALLAVLILAGITAIATERYVGTLVDERRADLTRSLLVDAASTYNTGQPGWSDADLKPALELAAQSGTDVAVLDRDGAVVATTFADPQRAAATHRVPIVIGGQRVGTLDIRFNGRGLVASTDRLRRSLLHADAWSAGVAALLALAAAIIVARRLSAPVRSLTAAASAMSGGNRNARVGELLGAPSELGELAATFDTMADTIHAEEQLRRDLVADVAHELRTPVAVLQANCEALLDGVVARTPAQIASLHEEVVRLARMVEDLQTLSSAQAAALHLAREPCDLADIARTAAAGMASTADAAGVRLSTRLESAPIDGDPVRVHQIITNLLSNAIKFSGDGSTTTLAVRAGSGGAVLVVSDGGRGIDPADLPFVFERFWRSDPTNGPPGSGIGLAVARDLVVAHGGTIDIESTPGSGTRVTVRLPSHR